MAYRGDGFEGSCYSCGRDRIEVHQKRGAVGCSSCKEKYQREIADEEKAQRPTLRDQFAIAALNSFRSVYANHVFPRHAQEMAEHAYQLADALLAEREKKRPIISLGSGKVKIEN